MEKPRVIREFTAEQIETLARMVEEGRFSVGESNRNLHLKDISPHQGILPAGVIWPVTTQEVSRIVAWAWENRVPVVPWGRAPARESTGWESGSVSSWKRSTGPVTDLWNVSRNSWIPTTS